MERLRRDKERTSGIIRTMLEHLEHALFEPSLSVQTWKRACNIRDNSIAIRFHQTLGVPPRTYIERLRLDVASKLLSESRLRVWQIAELLGFSSLGVFSRAFRRCAGIGPKEYRRRAQTGGSSPVTFSSVEMEKAARGDLEEDRARRLIQGILERYPGLRIEPLPGGSSESEGPGESTWDASLEPGHQASTSNR